MREDLSGRGIDDRLKCHAELEIEVRATHALAAPELAKIRLFHVGLPVLYDWRLKRIKGSHHHFDHPSKPGLVTVPHPKRDIPLPTLRSIYRQASLSRR
ncbi:MAG: type II toxin-antitoxin system HicA family toxin [Xanthomonadaceae bacterium]|nr:type II toxin-antitoxin system HicA family toxin [Xanthomonadaceae bacterium]